MLRIYETMLDVLRMLRPVLLQIERHDRDLPGISCGASASVPLNIAEASGSAGGTRNVRYRTALGSAREAGACLDVAMALGYVESVDAGLLTRLDEVRAVLAKVVR